MAVTQVNGTNAYPAGDTNSHYTQNTTEHPAGKQEHNDRQAADSVAVAQTQQSVPQTAHGIGHGPRITDDSDGIDVLCGPLINYRHMSEEHTANPVWHGSVLVVTKPGQTPEELSVKAASTVGAQQSGTSSSDATFKPIKLYEDPKAAFWQYTISVPFQEQESTWEYLIPQLRYKEGNDSRSKPTRWVVPSKHVSMRIMFHSCNGFSVGTDEEEWSGPALWNDVLRIHEERPIHVMLGGGDQIYNDSVRVTGPLKAWTNIGNPIKRREYRFTEQLRAECDEFYFNNYVRWYNTKPFSTANSQIPQVNIWDDHDIIDGFGSYTAHFMQSPVFRGIGGVAHKYYLLFQHHIAPPVSTFTSDAPQTTKGIHKTAAPDAVQLQNSYVKTSPQEDPSYLIGSHPGPYVNECSRSLYCQLGKSIALLGIDARTERTRHQINYPETYDLVFRHAEAKLSAANGAIKHLILLLGIPIAYPRLQWLENILSSPIIGPIKFLNKRFGLAGDFFNQFDGQPDLLDDLDDHYTSRTHKKERKMLMHRLQVLSQKQGVRVTILGGDVHLAAMGRFFSKPALNIPVEQDHRFMPNIVSSAITNHPPPQAVANLLAKRNKIHRLDHETQETLLEIWDEDPARGEKGIPLKAATSNKATMPSRNFAIISESHQHPSSGQVAPVGPAHANGTVNGHADAAEPNGVNGINGANAASHINGSNGIHADTNGVNGVHAGTNGTTATNGATTSHTNGVDGLKSFDGAKNPRKPLHSGEVGAGINHPAATGTTYTGLCGPYGLDVAYRVEINHQDRQGKTSGYGLSIPALEATIPAHGVHSANGVH